VESAGVKVLPISTIATLRAACGYLQFSRSGSKAKLWQRITACIDKQKLHEAVQISEQLGAEKEREPVDQPLTARPEGYNEVSRTYPTKLGGQHA